MYLVLYCLFSRLIYAFYFVATSCVIVSDITVGGCDFWWRVCVTYFCRRFGKMRKATISFVISLCVYTCPSVCLSVRMEQLGSTRRTDLYEIWYLSIFRNSVDKFIKIWQEQRAQYTKTYVQLWWNLTELFIKWETFQTRVVEKTKAHILCAITFIFFKSCLYDIIWKNKGKLDRPQTTI